MKGKNKTQKGITLIALMITVAVLLTIATVTINSIRDYNIIGYTENAAQKYNQAVKNEQNMLNEYIEYLEGMGKATVGTKVERVSTINGQKYTANNPVIPVGFMPINTETSNWNGADLAAEVKKGLVISDGTNEFVWIPVANINEMAKVTKGTDANGRTNYEGVLYDFTASGAKEKTGYGQSTGSFKEPANLSTTYDNTTNLSIWTKNLYQESFNKMVESVAKYKGFYVGRYEISLNGSVAQSRLGQTPKVGATWHQLYKYSMAYSTSNTKLGVVSEMIWGCQWDAMLKFILTGPQASHVIGTGNVGHTSSQFKVKPYASGGTNYSSVYTGNIGYNDIASNIYDLEGNAREWTQEYGGNTSHRVERGGDWAGSSTPATRWAMNLSDDLNHDGSRLTLYVAI